MYMNILEFRLGLCWVNVWKIKVSINILLLVIYQVMSVLKLFVVLLNVVGNENILVLIIELIIKEVRVGKDNLFVDELVMMFLMMLDKLS